MKTSEILALLARLQAAYREQISEAERNLWIEKFTDVEPAVAHGAVEAFINSDSAFMPKVGQILSAIRELGRPSPAEAWEEVLQQVRRVGYLGDPTFTHPAIDRAVELMGWRWICNSEEDSPFPARDFERLYGGVVEGAERRAALVGGWDQETRALVQRAGR